MRCYFPAPRLLLLTEEAMEDAAQSALKRLKRAGVISGEDALSTVPWNELRVRLARALGGGVLSVADMLAFFRTSRAYWQRNTNSFWSDALAVKLKLDSAAAFERYLEALAFRPAQIPNVNFLRLFLAASRSRTAAKAVFKKRAPGGGTIIHINVKYLRPMFEYSPTSTVRYRVDIKRPLRSSSVSYRAAVAHINSTMSKLTGMHTGIASAFDWYSERAFWVLNVSSPTRLFYELMQDGWYGDYGDEKDGERLYLRDVVVVRPSWGF